MSNTMVFTPHLITRTEWIKPCAPMSSRKFKKTPAAQRRLGPFCRPPVAPGTPGCPRASPTKHPGLTKPPVPPAPASRHRTTRHYTASTHFQPSATASGCDSGPFRSTHPAPPQESPRNHPGSPRITPGVPPVLPRCSPQRHPGIPGVSSAVGRSSVGLSYLSIL